MSGSGGADLENHCQSAFQADTAGGERDVFLGTADTLAAAITPQSR
ncbi:hypothetical protein Rcae01_00753 [Novipirellula caenicola]|uniref:Uncharacterized protein n=1 Tax=Novipirellula caenicola TaxID=1536901 RepID=A0ABP9VJC7_9BACT